MLGLNAARLVPRDADDVVGDARLLHTPSGMGPLPDVAIAVAHAAMGIVDVPRPFAGHDLVRLARFPIEVKDEFESRRQAPVPVAR